MEEPALKPADHHDISASCRNCDATVSGNFCHHCGQETRTHAPSFMEFAHEFIGHYVALEGRLWGTFGRLMFRPGALTNEYLAGRRRRYVEPLRLYLSLSILFFALLKFTNTEPVILNDNDERPAAVQEVAEGAVSIKDEIRKNGAVKDKQTGKVVELDERLREKAPTVARVVDKFEHMSTTERQGALTSGFFRYGPYAMFALMPLFALYLKVLYLGSGRRYGEHLLFALHVSSFAFVQFAAIKLVGDKTFVAFLLICWLIGYLPWAMRRVYGGGKFMIFARWSLLMLAHGISLAVAISVAMGAGAVTAH